MRHRTEPRCPPDAPLPGQERLFAEPWAPSPPRAPMRTPERPRARPRRRPVQLPLFPAAPAG
ncbi:MAG: hypothetical protein JNM72_03540 [Deltaproteobacteria bacterium]|jgi:hypothetical protein|nr:hypothetical protein [Deltaproteobacteria bacterium]